MRERRRDDVARGGRPRRPTRRRCAPGCARRRRSRLRRRRAGPRRASRGRGCRSACRAAARDAPARRSTRWRRLGERRRPRAGASSPRSRCARRASAPSALAIAASCVALPRGVLLDALLRDDALVVDGEDLLLALARRRPRGRGRARSDPRTRRECVPDRRAMQPGPHRRAGACARPDRPRSSTVSSPNIGQPGAAFDAASVGAGRAPDRAHRASLRSRGAARSACRRRLRRDRRAALVVALVADDRHDEQLARARRRDVEEAHAPPRDPARGSPRAGRAARRGSRRRAARPRASASGRRSATGSRRRVARWDRRG